MITPLLSKTIEAINAYEIALQNDDAKNPLLIVFPSKKDVGVSICLSLLKQYWLEDIEMVDNDIVFSNGDILTIRLPPKENVRKNYVNRRVKYCGMSGSNIVIQASDTGENTSTIPLNNFKNYIQVERGNYRLSGITDFISARKELFLDGVNNYTSFLELDYFINPENLKSKVYFICGRGVMGDTRDFLIRHNLSDIITEDQNFFLKENFIEFNTYFDRLNQAQNAGFAAVVTAILCQIDETYGDSILELKERILYNIINNSFNSTEFKNIYEELIDDLEAEENEDASNIHDALLMHINLLYTSSNLLENVKVVIVNNMKVAAENQQTINDLLNSGIPVVILIDRALYKKDKREQVTLLLSHFQESYKVNWKRENLVLLTEDPNENCWDIIPYNLAKRFQKQQVVISRFAENDDADKLYGYFEIQAALNQLLGHEQLKQDYYDYLRPVIYWYKNSIGDLNNNNIGQLLVDSMQAFRQTYDLVSPGLGQINSELNNNLRLAIEIFSNFNVNNKLLNPAISCIFNQRINKLNNAPFKIANDINHVYEIEQDAEYIQFSGYPYKEYTNTFLNSAIFDECIPNIEILAWCREGESIKRNIEKTVQLADQILNNLPPNFNILEGAVEDYLTIKGTCNDSFIPEAIDDIDKNQGEIEGSRYSGYSGTQNEGLQRVRVLEFNGGGKMFLSDKSKKIFTYKGRNTFDDCKWEEINTGDTILYYNLTRHISIDMRPDSGLSGNLDTMDYWYTVLQNLFITQCDSNLNELELMLNSVDIPRKQVHSFRAKEDR